MGDSLIARLVKQHGAEKVAKMIPPSLRAALPYCWEAIARPEQLEPQGLRDGSVGTWWIQCGRGWGKSRTGKESTRGRVKRRKARAIALVGYDYDDVRRLQIEGPSGLLQVPDDERPLWEPSKRTLTWPQRFAEAGAFPPKATVFSSKVPGGLRGPEFDWFWGDEPAKWAYLEATWSNLKMATRQGAAQGVATTTPRPRSFIRQKILSDPRVLVTRGTTYENRANLAANFFAELAIYEGTRLGRQELLGELLTDTPGALWTLDQIDRLRVTDTPDLERIVIAVDPATTSQKPDEEEGGETSATGSRRKKRPPDETAIIVAGRSSGLRHAYVLDDLSNRDPVGVWAVRVVDAFHEYKADAVVAEVNQGGELVVEALRAVDANLPIVTVHAKRGKVTRAQPVSALYARGKVHHVGGFSQLEDQLATFVEGESDFSPDRMDALVYALIELLLKGGVGGGGWC